MPETDSKSGAMSYSLTFEITALPPTTNGSHGHWRKKAKIAKQWRQLTLALAIRNGIPPKPLEKADLVLTRFSAVEPDYDNLVISFKPVIDGLRDAGVLTDDKMSVIGVPSYQWQKTTRNLGKIRVEVFSSYGDNAKGN